MSTLSSFLNPLQSSPDCEIPTETLLAKAPMEAVSSLGGPRVFGKLIGTRGSVGLMEERSRVRGAWGPDRLWGNMFILLKEANPGHCCGWQTKKAKTGSQDSRGSCGHVPGEVTRSRNEELADRESTGFCGSSEAAASPNGTTERLQTPLGGAEAKPQAAFRGAPRSHSRRARRYRPRPLGDTYSFTRSS